MPKCLYALLRTLSSHLSPSLAAISNDSIFNPTSIQSLFTLSILAISIFLFFVARCSKPPPAGVVCDFRRADAAFLVLCDDEAGAKRSSSRRWGTCTAPGACIVTRPSASPHSLPPLRPP
ncbi:hypothetical protein AcW1_001138 [Taiwanofungus camphoratus]|nr:hypothetical protein AcW2_000350 [Antrodia cinnamomea]KAI0937065.1 hypothetical protein AcV5_005052 [Antrodia cinnamomea]KAI0962281.1 hypothetical protein AcV7_001161 [Antrodia cinnamomea]KAI0964282.1 hypothetical protein AcW1_001138 [Antrodia cinnamomea]